MDDIEKVFIVTKCTYLPITSQVEFDFPIGVFGDKDWVALELTFDATCSSKASDVDAHMALSCLP